MSSRKPNRCRYLIYQITTGTDNNNTVSIVDLDQIPVSNKTGALDFSSFKFAGGDQSLPTLDLVANFDAEWRSVLTNGTTFWFMTNKDAPNYR